MSIEFVSYTGKYPCLCSGILTVRIDGEEVVFEDPFWVSGGACHYDTESTTKAPWEVKVRTWIPEKYRQYADELIQVFNENVPFGCCGGCL